MELSQQRESVASFAHSRPFQKLAAPLAATHYTIISQASIADVYAVLGEITQALALTLPPMEVFIFTRNDEVALRYEHHNEYYTLTLYRFGQPEPMSLEPQWYQQLPGELLTHAALYLFSNTEQALFRSRCEQILGDHLPAGAEVMSGAARVWTTFRPDAEGRVSILIQDRKLTPHQDGRLLQRLCEIETYRHMALLGLTLAAEAMPTITRLDQTLADIVHRLSESGDSASELLAELTRVAAEAEALSADTANRFGATEAYFAVLDKRITELREERVEGYQTLAQFVERRLEPARKTCLAATRRIDWLSNRVARASELIRSQVELSIEQQNRDLLSSMDGRSQRQLRLQAKLESFSIIVVTYYAFDLLDRTLLATLPKGYHPQAELLLSWSVPVIALGLWWYIRRVLKHYAREDDGSAGEKN